MESVSGISRSERCRVILEIWRILRGMFHVKHGVPTTNQLFHVKRRTGWLSCGGMVFENCFHPIVAEELVFHVKPENSRKFFLTVGGMRFDFSVGHNT